jgi:hypothetical protein
MNQLLREAKLKDLEMELKAQGKPQAQINIILCELRQNSFSIGMSGLLGFFKICNN